MSVEGFKLQEIGKCLFNDIFDRGSRPTGTVIEPAGHNFTMHQLNVAIAQEYVLWGLGCK